jgi:hypothetical protein
MKAATVWLGSVLAREHVPVQSTTIPLLMFEQRIDRGSEQNRK